MQGSRTEALAHNAQHVPCQAYLMQKLWLDIGTKCSNFRFSLWNTNIPSNFVWKTLPLQFTSQHNHRTLECLQ